MEPPSSQEVKDVVWDTSSSSSIYSAKYKSHEFSKLKAIFSSSTTPNTESEKTAHSKSSFLSVWLGEEEENITSRRKRPLSPICSSPSPSSSPETNFPSEKQRKLPYFTIVSNFI